MRNFYLIAKCILKCLLLISPNCIRIFILNASGAKIARNAIIHRTVKIDFPWRLTIGRNSEINRGVYLDCRGGKISIGKNCDIAEDVIIYTLSHDHLSRDMKIKKGSVVVQDHVWICTRAILLPNTDVGCGSVVGAHVVLNKDVENFRLIFQTSNIAERLLPVDRATEINRKNF